MTALGLYALVQAAPAATHHSARPAHPAFDVAAMDRRGPSDNLADDAAAAGETGRAQPETPQPYRRPTPPQTNDPIGAMIAAAPPTAPDDVFDLPYPRTETAHAARHLHVAPAHHPAPRPLIHRAGPHVTTPVASPARPAKLAAKPAPRPAPRPAIVLPHRLHILVQPPARPVLTPETAPPPLDASLPQVQAGRPPIIDLDARLAELTGIAAADMSGADFEISPDLSAGHDGAVVVRLPERLIADLQAKAEDDGFDLDAHPLSVSVALSANGYVVTPQETLTSQIQPDHAAAYSWTVRPTGAGGGTLSATLTASLQAEGEPVSAPLGMLTAEIPAPPPVAAEPDAYAAQTPPLTASPAPAFSQRVRAGLARMGLGHLNLHGLAIPGRPTLNLPLLGEVASYKVVAVALLLLALMFLRSLLHGSSVRAERRRRFEAFDREYFENGAH